MNQLEKDVKFLQDLNLLDYSLLLGIKKNDSENAKDFGDKIYFSNFYFISSSQTEYFLGIIDFLTEFDS